MYTLYKFHFLNGISEINQLFDDILIIWPAPVYIYIYIYIQNLIGISYNKFLIYTFYQIFKNLIYNTIINKQESKTIIQK